MTTIKRIFNVKKQYPLLHIISGFVVILCLAINGTGAAGGGGIFGRSSSIRSAVSSSARSTLEENAIKLGLHPDDLPLKKYEKKCDERAERYAKELVKHDKTARFGLQTRNRQVLRNALEAAMIYKGVIQIIYPNLLMRTKEAELRLSELCSKFSHYEDLRQKLARHSVPLELAHAKSQEVGAYDAEHAEQDNRVKNLKKSLVELEEHFDMISAAEKGHIAILDVFLQIEEKKVRSIYQKEFLEMFSTKYTTYLAHADQMISTMKQLNFTDNDLDRAVVASNSSDGGYGGVTPARTYSSAKPPRPASLTQTFNLAGHTKQSLTQKFTNIPTNIQPVVMDDGSKQFEYKSGSLLEVPTGGGPKVYKDRQDNIFRDDPSGIKLIKPGKGPKKESLTEQYGGGGSGKKASLTKQLETGSGGRSSLTSKLNTPPADAQKEVMDDGNIQYTSKSGSILEVVPSTGQNVYKDRNDNIYRNEGGKVVKISEGKPSLTAQLGKS